MTINKLAHLVISGFKKIDNRFTQIDNRFTQNEASFDKKLEKLAVSTQRGFVELDKKINGRIDGLESRMDKLEATVIRSKNELEIKITNANVHLASFKLEHSGHMDHIYGKLEEIHQENIMSSAQYRRHDDQLESHEHRLTKLESRPRE